MIEATVIADSISPHGIRLTTMHLRYPRFIHAEFMTHRVFSRNARSSRAVPVSRLMAEEPYIPHFMKNQPGMQSFEELDELSHRSAKAVWQDLIQTTRDAVERLHAIGVHKQWANRPLEWFGFIDTLCSSTEWANWYALRDHPAAMPEIQELAREMKIAHEASRPKPLNPGQWHLPYVDEPPRLGDDNARCRISAARCARLSYKPFDSETADPEKDYQLFDKLLVERPVHASPAEHQATPDTPHMTISEPRQVLRWHHADQHGNFTGWRQFRKMLEHEAVMDEHHARL
jgi:hypothetical protein